MELLEEGVQTTGVDRSDADTPVADITITLDVSSPQLSIPRAKRTARTNAGRYTFEV